MWRSFGEIRSRTREVLSNSDFTPLMSRVHKKIENEAIGKWFKCKSGGNSGGTSKGKSKKKRKGKSNAKGKSNSKKGRR